MSKVRLNDHFGIILSDPKKVTSRELRSDLDEYGCIIFKNWTQSKTEFKYLSELLSDQFITHGAKVRRSVDHQATQTVTKGPDKIILHFEMHYSPIAPDYMWFFCEVAPKIGGETTLGDGRVIYDQLSEPLRSQLHEKGIRYTNIWAEETIQKYFPKKNENFILESLKKLGAHAHFLDNGELKFVYNTSPFTKDSKGRWVFGNTIAIHHQYRKNLKLFQETDQTLRHEVCFGDGSSIPESSFHEIEQLSDELAVPYKWENGDIVLVDNKTILHGRNSYDPKIEREILVRMGVNDSNPAHFLFAGKDVEHAS